MGSRGPLPKPAERAQGHRAREPARVLELLPAKEATPAEAWGDEVKAWWDAYWRSDVAEVASEVDLPVISRLFVMYDGYEKAIGVVHKAIVVKGSTGQIRVNPIADYAFKLGRPDPEARGRARADPFVAAAAHRGRREVQVLDELNRSPSQTDGGTGRDPRLAVYEAGS